MKKLDIDLLRLDRLVQMRALGEDAHVDSSVVAEYREAMEEGAAFPPVVAFYDGLDYWLADGFHRVEAARGLKRKKVDVEVREGTLRDAQLFAMQANLRHGARATRADKEKAVLVLLTDHEWCKWSQGEIAKRAGVAISTVANIRARHNLQAPTERTYTRGGQVHTMQTKGIGKKPAAKAKEEEPRSSALQIGELPELDTKEQRKAQEFADKYGVSLAEAERFQMIAKKKRLQDAQDRAERLAQARMLKQKKARALKRKTKALSKKELAALALVQQVALKLEADVEDLIAVITEA